MSSLSNRLLIVGLLVVFAQPGRSHAADAPTPGTFTVKGVKLHYVVAGKGEPVVLIHGLHSSIELNWQVTSVVGLLAADHQVIALDLPGHGQSDKPDKDDAYGGQMVEDVVTLMDHLKVSKAHIVGYSMGGMVAVKFLTKHPDRALSGTLGGMGWLRDGSGLQKVWELMGARDAGRTPAACVRNIGKLAVSEDELKAIKIPVTMLVGDRDPCRKMYVEPAKAVRKDWPVVEIADASHINCIVKEQFRLEISKWIAKNTKK